MQITIKTMTGKTFTVEVESSDTISSLKEKIEPIEGVKLKDQKLVY